MADPRRHLINISKPLVTNFKTRAKIVTIIPGHPYPLVVATNADKPLELRCFDVYGNPANNHTFILYNTDDADAPRMEADDDYQKSQPDEPQGTGR